MSKNTLPSLRFIFNFKENSDWYSRDVLTEPFLLNVILDPVPKNSTDTHGNRCRLRVSYFLTSRVHGYRVEVEWSSILWFFEGHKDPLGPVTLGPERRLNRRFYLYHV